MKTVTINLYSFDELNEDAKENAINHFSQDNNPNWYDPIFEDAKEAGIELGEFDIDSASFVYNLHGKFITSAGEVVETILNNHGKKCETYKTAKKYKHSFQLCSDETDEEELDKTEDEFLAAILDDYKEMLQQELEYTQSREFAIELIEANDYFFYSDGSLTSCTIYVGKHEKAGITEFHFHGQTIQL